MDAERLRFPNDREILAQMQGQTWTYNRAGIDLYGRRRVYSMGQYHILDACRMAVLGWTQDEMEEKLAAYKGDDVLDFVLA